LLAVSHPRCFHVDVTIDQPAPHFDVVADFLDGLIGPYRAVHLDELQNCEEQPVLPRVSPLNYVRANVAVILEPADQFGALVIDTE
jgi:hypothetical protein